MRTCLLVPLALGLLLAGPAQAHKASDAYLSLGIDADRITQRFDIALRDLDRDLTLDQDDDGQLRWGEVRQRWPQIEALADAGLQLRADGRPCRSVASGPAQLTEHSDGAYAVLTRTWQCEQPVRALDLQYRLFADSDPTHRGILRIDRTGGADTAGPQTAVLVPHPAGAPQAEATQHIELAGAGSAGPTGPTGLRGFIAEGVHHILIGTDHVLFLLALLLPAVLVRRPPGADRSGPASGGTTGVATAGLAALRSRPIDALPAGPGSSAAALALDWPAPRSKPATSPWQAAPALRPALLDVVRVVSAFTLAHSITLALAVLDVLDPPSRWVESIIAASVVFAALNNLRPMVGEGRWRLTFVFGLVHGFGFAGALKDLGLDGAHLATSLLGFNLGVELGQLAIVALFLPLAWQLRRSRFYQRGLLVGGSVLIALLAGVWLVERAFDLRLLSL
ncbi:MAG: hypothetical protein RLY71_1976 [Pseudomonadota bacterium]|jgi:hypothetical protein